MEATSLARRGGLGFPRSRRLLAALSDERLVDQLRRGNEVAFEVIYDRHHRRILSFCRHMLGSREEAEDAVQQTFISAYGELSGGTREIKLKPWLFTIARNRCLSMLRARRERADDAIEPSTAGLAEEAQHRADVQELLADLAELPEDQRAALVLSELGDLSHAEVAQIVGCQMSKVKSLVFQARSGLHERREAREIPCREIQEQLATLRGGSLRRGVLRRHLQACPACAEFRAEVRRQRRAMAIALPVIPSIGLKESAMAAVGLGGSAAGGVVAAGGTAGGVGSVLGGAGIAKVLVATAIVGGAAAGGLAVTGGDDERSTGPADRSAPLSAPGSGPAGAQSEQSAPGGQGTIGGLHRRQDGENPAKRRSESGTEHGFTPVPGESNGERARDFAKTRGQGQKGGLYKPREQKTPPAYGKNDTRPDRGQDRRLVPTPRPDEELQPEKGKGRTNRDVTGSLLP
jgi:RNA polymerase sigma factor (sigma-70 family)